MATAAEILDAPDWEQEEGSPGESQELQLRERLRAIVGRLEKEADDRVAKRELVERRWIEDLTQFHGKYEAQIESNLTRANKSRLFINQTRSKTNAMEARLSDMLFPTDDRNWGIKPTPVPELTVEAEDVAMRAAEAKRAAAENPEDPALQQAAQTIEQEASLIEERMKEARRRSRAMEEEIADHLKECKYAIQARDVIHDACVLGTGIMKGPVIGGRTRRSWQQAEAAGPDGTLGSTYQMAEVTDPRPVFWRVDPWNIFPDFDARTPDECESWYERHLMNPKELKRLARQPGFDADAIRTLLRDKPRSSTPTYIADLRSITGAYHDTSMERYHVWEYHGPLSAEDMIDLASATGRGDMLEDLAIDPEEIDPLDEMQVQIWFCQGEILKFGIHHLDSGDSIYSVFCLEKDAASIFGFGVPYIMRDAQRSLNAAWRTMMDNAALSSGPQVILNQKLLEPANGRWDLEPRKVWYRKDSTPTPVPAAEMFNIPSFQEELANIIELSKRNIDEETNVSMIAQGEQGTHTTQTAHGMSMLMNATNVVFRRIVKNWDDDMTTPNIRRMYDFLMQFSEKDYIKGDYEVDARGTSVLLVREMQSANLMAFLVQFAAHPTLSVFLKDQGLPVMRKLAQTMMIPAEEIIKSDDDLAQEAAEAAESPPEPNLEIMKIEAQMNLAEIERQTKLELAQIERETALMKLAEQHNMKLDELQARLQEGQASRDSRERTFAAEAAMEQRNAARGIARPSGGHISVSSEGGA